MAHLHAAALKSLTESEFVAVCDADPGRSEAFADQYGVKAFTDVATMVEIASAQAAIICTPHPLHAPPAIVAAERGTHLLIEKPLASTLADCDAMISAAAKHRVMLGVVSQRRFFEPVARMKAAIDAGKIGRLFSELFRCSVGGTRRTTDRIHGAAGGIRREAVS